ncbi:hypothetical protein C8Q76DRAFT_50807 [Earliella scabrosa]|nr:hypothetical protein C8Q76DRAFT_50807 [Earliella scabrosa]
MRRHRISRNHKREHLPHPSPARPPSQRDMQPLGDRPPLLSLPHRARGPATPQYRFLPRRQRRVPVFAEHERRVRQGEALVGHEDSDARSWSTVRSCARDSGLRTQDLPPTARKRSARDIEEADAIWERLVRRAEERQEVLERRLGHDGLVLRDPLRQDGLCFQCVLPLWRVLRRGLGVQRERTHLGFEGGGPGERGRRLQRARSCAGATSEDTGITLTRYICERSRGVDVAVLLVDREVVVEARASLTSCTSPMYVKLDFRAISAPPDSKGAGMRL